MQRWYVTTTIPYVNAPPHVGFALELAQADAIARYRRLIGHEVRLQSGTDENAFKNVLAARQRGIAVQELVDLNAARFRQLSSALDVSLDGFVRTSGDQHRAAVHAFLARLDPGDVYSAGYRGLYCTGCEDFWLERDADQVCPDHGTPFTTIEEDNWFFRLSRYAGALHECIRSGRLRVVPEAREAEVLRFIERGLTDISLSRDAARADGWGIPYPGDASQVVYVWIDALVNYLTGSGFPNPGWECWWQGGAHRVHLIGKNVWKFHAVYWPALLLSAGLSLPDEIAAHGFLTINGRKISKSAGDAPDPFADITRLGVDAVRYFLLRHVRPFADGDYASDRLAAVYTSDLANGLGNLVSRLCALCERAGVVIDDAIAGEAPAGYHDAATDYRFDDALTIIWSRFRTLDRELSEGAPWRAPDDPAVRDALHDWALQLRTLAHWLSPYLPGAARRIRTALTGSTRRVPPLFPKRIAAGGTETAKRGEP